MIRLLALLLLVAANAHAADAPADVPPAPAPAPDPTPPPEPAAKPAPAKPAPASDAPEIEVRTEGRPHPKDLGTPGLILGPTITARYPYQWIGGGLFADIMIANTLNIYGQAQYGLATSSAPSGDVTQIFWEAYVGYPFTWEAPGKVDLILEEKNEGDVLVATFTKVEVTLHHTIVAEGGLQSGRESFTRLVSATDAKTQKDATFTLPFDRRVTTLAIGARYLQEWNSEMGDGFPKARNYQAIYAHFLLPAVGAPDGIFHVGRSLQDTRTDPSHWGLEVGTTYSVWANSPVPLDIAAGWLPGGLGLYLSIGVELPVWVL